MVYLDNLCIGAAGLESTEVSNYSACHGWHGQACMRAASELILMHSRFVRQCC